MQWILLILGVILAVVAVFALQNPDVVSIRFLNLSGEASVLVVILIAYAVGVLSGVLALVPSSVRKSARLRKLRSEVKTLEKQAGVEPTKAKAEKVKPDQRRFREVEAESTRTPVIERPSPAPAVPAPATKQPAIEPLAAKEQTVERPALGVPAPPASSTGSTADVPFADRVETAESSLPSGSSSEGENTVDGGDSGSSPVPVLDAEPSADAGRGWRRFLGL